MSAVTSVHVSKTAIEAIGESIPLRCNSQPKILISKPIFCPITNFAFESAMLNSFKTVSKSAPKASANSVEIPWIRSAS